MHVDVSISLATTGCVRMPGAGGPADARTIVRFAATSHLFQFDEEALVLGRERIRIDDGRGHEVRERALLFAAAEEAPVNREPDLIRRLAGHLHWLDAFG